MLDINMYIYNNIFFRGCTKSGFINEPCSPRNTINTIGTKLIFPRNNTSPQCIDTSKISRRLARKKFFSLNALRNLQTIYGENSGLHRIYDVSFLQQLEELYFSHNFVTKFDPRVFINNRKLRIVKLDFNKIRIPVNVPILYSRSIDTLDLSNNGFRKLYTRTFQGMPNLRVLYLQGNQIRHIYKFTFATLHSLKFLQLEGNPLTSLSFVKPDSLKAKYIIQDVL